MNSFLIAVLIASLTLLQVNAFLPSSVLKASTILKSLGTRLQFKNFDEMLEQLEVPVLVDFYAQWCGPCQMMQPVLEDVANRLENDAKVAKVDTDKAPKLGLRYQVEALPTLILFYKGQVVERYVGYRSADDLEKEVRVALKRIKDAPV